MPELAETRGVWPKGGKSKAFSALSLEVYNFVGLLGGFNSLLRLLKDFSGRTGL